MSQSLNDLIRASIVHIADCLDAIDIDQAFSDAVYDARITQYGRAVATRAALLSIRQQLQQLLPAPPPHSLGTPAQAIRAFPLQQDPTARCVPNGCSPRDAA